MQRICFVACFLVSFISCLVESRGISTCRDPGSIVHGSRIFLQGGRLIQFVCEDGYLPWGDPLLSCTRGQWRGKKPVCVAPGCPIARPWNIIRIEQMNGAVLRHECNSDFELRGDSVIYCNGKQWSGPTPTCQRVSPEVPNIAVLVSETQNPTEDGGTERVEEEIPDSMPKPFFVDSSDDSKMFNPGSPPQSHKSGILPLYKTTDNQQMKNRTEVAKNEGVTIRISQNRPRQERVMPRPFTPPLSPRRNFDGYPGQWSFRRYPGYSRPMNPYGMRHPYPFGQSMVGQQGMRLQFPQYRPYYPTGDIRTYGSRLRPILLNRNDNTTQSNQKTVVRTALSRTFENRPVYLTDREQQNLLRTGSVHQSSGKDKSKSTSVGGHSRSSSIGRNGRNNAAIDNISQETIIGGNLEIRSAPTLIQRLRARIQPEKISPNAVGSIPAVVGAFSPVSDKENSSIPNIIASAETNVQITASPKSCPPSPKPRRGFYVTRPLPPEFDDDKYLYLVEYKCLPGLVLVGGDNISYCSRTGEWSGNLPSCEEEPEPCVQGFERKRNGPCTDVNECSVRNGGCMQICRNFDGGYYCECSTGYELSMNRMTCLDIDECSVEERVCYHDCRNTPGSFMCTCKMGYSLMKHDNRTCIDINECLLSSLNPCEQLCQNTFGSFLCTCRPSFRLNDDGRSCSETCAPGYLMEIDSESSRQICVDENECLPNNGMGPCEQLCLNLDGSYSCSCTAGFQLHEDGLSCSDIDECKELEINRCAGNCLNSQGSFSCICPGNLILAEDRYSCSGCPEDSFLSPTGLECVKCPNNSVLHDDETAFGGSGCYCLPGYRGSPDLSIPCDDINECDDDNYGCSHDCINTQGSVFCECPEGYVLELDGRNCQDLDECQTSLDKCGQGGRCDNHDGGYNCSCMEGYVRDGSNDGICVAARGTCPPLERFDRGRVFPPSPCNGNTPAPFGKVCVHACHVGYRLRGSIRRVCGVGGWSGTAPKCVPESWCRPLVISSEVRVIPHTCAEGVSRPWLLCLFSCKQISRRVQGNKAIRCGQNRKWSAAPPTCDSNSQRYDSTIPRITCPRDMDVYIAPGKSAANVTIARPITNMKIVEQRSDGRVSGNTFPAGTTRVRFTAFSDDRTAQASCDMRVRVKDREAPVIQRCPGSISIESNEEFPEVTWETPLFSDNVRIVDVKKGRFPSGNLTWGTYRVTYIASDASGNVAECAFPVIIKRPKEHSSRLASKCGTPIGPRNGKAKCSKWARGVYCTATCNSRYAFERRLPTYVCDENGSWSPSNQIPDCVDMRAILRKETIIPLSATSTLKTTSTASTTETRIYVTPDIRRPVNYTTTTKIPNTSLTTGNHAQEHTSGTTSSLPVSVARNATDCADGCKSRDISKSISTSGNSTNAFKPKITILTKPKFYRLPITVSDMVVKVIRKEHPDIIHGIPSPMRKIFRSEPNPAISTENPTSNVTECPRGRIPRINTNGVVSCVACPIGTYRPRVSTIKTCIPCSPGFYQDEPGMGHCVRCPNFAAHRRLHHMQSRRKMHGFRSVSECERIPVKEDQGSSSDPIPAA